jgi:hypothetical protein
MDQKKEKFSQPSPSNSAVLRYGIVLPFEHPSDPSLVYVHIGEKTANPNDNLQSGIWCHNNLGTFTRFRDIENNPVSYGNYTPIQPWTPVLVLFSNGGSGPGHIIGTAPTTTDTPDPENSKDLHVLAQSPKGSYVAIDDKSGNISVMHQHGSTGIILGENQISIEANKGKSSGKEGDTAINISKGSIEFKLRDSSMKFDESGLMLGFDDGGSYIKITKSGIELHGESHVLMTSKEEVSLKGSKMTLQGTKDASLNANHLKVGGKQLTSITGAQISMESNIAIGMKGLYIDMQAGAMINQKSSVFNGEYGATALINTPVMGFKNSSFAVKSGSIALGSSAIYMDGNVVSNSGLGNSLANSTTSSTQAAHTAVTKAFQVLGTTMLTKQAGISAANKTMADTTAGTSEPAQEATGNVGGAKDKNDKKSYGSVAATKYSKKNTVMEKFSKVPNLIYQSRGLFQTREGVPLTSAGLEKLYGEVGITAADWEYMDNNNMNKYDYYEKIGKAVANDKPLPVNAQNAATNPNDPYFSNSNPNEYFGK